ncbi:MAG TPA: alkaline phosphatase family protein, partial [Luteitalea sp.]|nr:alkaline phosphatase family protein [Luteitalea sp.]
VFTRHHAVYPTVTRVNAASFATGAYPETHGLLGNSVYFPKIDAQRFLDTADREALARIAASEPLVTAPTIGDRLRAAGRQMLVVSAGSSGSAVLNHPTMAGGAILHPDFVVPETLASEMSALGPAPRGEGRATARDRYAVDAFLKVGLPRIDPAVTVLWLGALDSTTHARGLGDPAAVAVLRHIDEQIGRVEDGLAAAGELGGVDIWVTSDHGFSTHTGAPDVTAALAPHRRTKADGTTCPIASGGAIYVCEGDDAAVPAIVRALQQTPGIGAIFTRPATAGGPDGVVAGTLSFDLIRWRHARSAQILYSPDWTDAANAQAIRGTVSSNGVAGHGSASPWDVHNTLIAAGPDIARGVTIDVPSANVDLMPTFLGLLGLELPSTVQGRVLDEARAGRMTAQPPTVRTSEHTAKATDGRYSVTASVSTVSSHGRDYRYFDSARVSRR